MAIDVSPDVSPEPSRRLARVSRQIAADVSPPPSPGSPSLEQRARQAAEKAIAARSPPPKKPPPKRIPATETPVYADKNAGSEVWDLPPQPTRPICVHVGSNTVELRWTQPDGEHATAGFQVSVQVGGAGGFLVCIAHTHSAQTRAVLRGLTPQTWYEFRVASINAHGMSAAGVASHPCVTLPTTEALHAEAEARAARKADRRRGVRFATRTSEDAKDEADLEREYASVKQALLGWDEAFAESHGRAPTETERLGNKRYSTLLGKYKALRRQRRRSSLVGATTTADAAAADAAADAAAVAAAAAAFSTSAADAAAAAAPEATLLEAHGERERQPVHAEAR